MLRRTTLRLKDAAKIAVEEIDSTTAVQRARKLMICAVFFMHPRSCAF